MTSIRTNLGPLTTPFTYPASCAVVVKDCDTCNVGWQAQTCSDNQYNTQGVQDNVDCWPPRASDKLTSDVAVMGWGFYSPGLECPVGYATACATTPGVDGGFQFQFSKLSEETVVGCCPSGYSCSYDPSVDAAQTCFKYIKTGSFPTVQCSSGTSNQFSYVTIPQIVTATPRQTVARGTISPTVVAISNILVFAPLIQLNYQSTDTEALTSSETPETSQTSTSTPQTKISNGLSTGAQTGIGVACGLIGLVLLTVLGWWLRRRRRNRQLLDVTRTLPQQSYLAPQSYSEPKYLAEVSAERDAHEVEGTLANQHGEHLQQYTLVSQQDERGLDGGHRSPNNEHSHLGQQLRSPAEMAG